SVVVAMPSRVNDPPLGRMSADVHARFIDPAYAYHPPAPKNRQTRFECGSIADIEIRSMLRHNGPVQSAQFSFSKACVTSGAVRPLCRSRSQNNNEDVARARSIHEPG